MPSPTLMDAMRPVRRASWPSLTASPPPKSTAPTLSSSRFSTMPVTPEAGNSMSSPAWTFDSPYNRAMPSPTWSTVPTS